MMDDPHAEIVRSGAYRCVRCGYDLSGSAVGGNCPECGTNVSQSLRVAHDAAEGSSNTATICMVLGIVGLVTSCWLLGPVAIFLYYTARNQVRRGSAPPSSLGMAKAGLILGWISTGLMLLACCGYSLFFMLMGL